MDAIRIGKAEDWVTLDPSALTKHGLIAGATGTGKTTTLRVIAEQVAKGGVPVFMPDVKGDLCSLMQPGTLTSALAERLEKTGMPVPDFQAMPVEFWDLFGENGHPVRATVSDMGPLLLSHILELNEVQAGVLHIAFRWADDEGLLLLDLKDLRSVLTYIGSHAADIRVRYGQVAPSSIGAIERALLRLESEGAEAFFGEPALDIADLFAHGEMAPIHVLDARILHRKPKLYGAFLLWILSELYETLPEVGDVEQPRLLFFFDEAHLIFEQADRTLLDTFSQVIRLVRSKGIAVFFVTQRPTDIPDAVLGQLGSKIQHSLRAFTPKDRKDIRLVAENFRPNPSFDTAEALTAMQAGEALVSLIDRSGIPSVTERVMIAPPMSSMLPVDLADVRDAARRSALDAKYRESVDRESAYEILTERIVRAKLLEAAEVAAKAEKARALEQEREAARAERQRKRDRSFVEKEMERMKNAAVGTVGRGIGREILRGVLGSLLKR